MNALASLYSSSSANFLFYRSWRGRLNLGFILIFTILQHHGLAASSIDLSVIVIPKSTASLSFAVICHSPQVGLDSLGELANYLIYLKYKIFSQLFHIFEIFYHRFQKPFIRNITIHKVPITL